MNTSSFFAVAVIAGLAFAAGWVMNEKYNKDDKNDDTSIEDEIRRL